MPAQPYEQAARLLPELMALNRDLYEKPELSGHEYQAATRHKDLLAHYDFIVEDLIFDEFATAFRATYDTGRPGLCVGFLSEYDALPEIGHGCGHNLLGCVSTGAAILLKQMLEQDNIGGKVLLFGTPAEETIGGKIPMAESAVFDCLDCVLMSHPYNQNRISGRSRACIALEVEFFGKASHAAAAPEFGINALNAITLLLTGINFNREHWPSDVQVHGYIVEGGTKANIVPEHTRARFYVRAATIHAAKQAEKRFREIVQGASLMTGTHPEIHYFEYTTKDLVTNPVLSNLCTRQMELAGLSNISNNIDFGGSLDIGNVSQIVPCVHPYFDITGDLSIALHTRAFAENTITDYAYTNMLKMAIALAGTACELMHSPSLQQQMRAAHEKMNMSK